MLFIKPLSVQHLIPSDLLEACAPVRLPMLFVGAYLSACVVILALFWDDGSFIATSYHALSLGMDRETVEYVQGAPALVLDEKALKSNGVMYHPDKTIALHASTVWTYASGVSVAFNQHDKVISVGCFVSADPQACEALFGLKIGDSEDVLIGKLGDDYESKIISGKKLIYYSTLNAKFYLEKRRIIGLELSEFNH